MNAPGTGLRSGPNCPPAPRVATPTGAPARPAWGWGLGGVLLALICVTVVVLGSPPWAPVQRAPDAAVACAEPAPGTAAAYTAAFAHLPGGWLAGDQVSSAALPDGRIVWLFADTLVSTGAADDPDVHCIHSSFVLQSAGCFTPLLGPAGDGVVPAPAQEQWYWPQHAVVDGDRMWVTVLRVTGGEPDSPDFALLGVDLAEFAMPRNGLPHLVAVHTTPASGAGDFGVLWGTALVTEGRTLYVYGTRRTSEPLVGKQLLLARVPLSRVAEASAWRFRTLDGWSAAAEDAVVLVPAHGGVSTALSAHRSSAGWVLVTKRDDFLGDAVVALVGPQPWGPFRERVLFDSTSRGTSLEYLAMAHPEVTLDDGSLLVSINRNDTSLGTVLRDPASFRPRFHAVAGLGSPHTE